MGILARLCSLPNVSTKPVTAESNKTTESPARTTTCGLNPVKALYTAIMGTSPAKALDSKSVDPEVIDKIKSANLINTTSLGGSRGKTAHLFDAEGNPTTKKSDAAFMIDNLMPESEQKHYQKLEKVLAKKGVVGVKVPELHGHHKDGNPIMQWLPNTSTFSAKTSLVSTLNRLEKLADINKNQPSYENPLKLDILEKFSKNIQSLINLKYDSSDFQFMMDNKTGDIYIMDLEENNKPRYGKANSQLSDLKTAVDQKIASLSKE